MKFVTIAAIAALSVTPVMAQTAAQEQARANYHQDKADSIRADNQQANAQLGQANSAASHNGTHKPQ